MINKYLLLLIVMISLSGCNLVNQLRLRNENNNLTAHWPEGQNQATIQSHFNDGKPYVFVSINGIDNFKLLVDTGAATTTLFNSPKVLKLNLTKGYELIKNGWGDEESSIAHQSSIAQLSLAGITFQNVSIGYLAASKTKYFLSDQELVFDGVLGYDIIRHFSWRFDKMNNQIDISNLGFLPKKHTTVLPFDIFFSRISIDTTLDFGSQQVQQALIIDTGSRHYLKLGTEFIAANNLPLPNKRVVSADFGLSGLAEHKRVTLPSVTLGNLNYRHVKTNIIKTDDDDEYLVLGNALLNQHVVVIDYLNGVMSLTPYPDIPYKSRYNLIGLELRKLLNENFIVRYIMPELAANESTIQVGDVIKSIDGIQSQQLTQEQWLDISNTAGIHEICLATSNACFSINAKEIEGYSFYQSMVNTTIQ